MTKQEDKTSIEISVIMPALNEEENILVAIDNTLKAFSEFKIDGEVIVVNDGSQDKTEELIRNAMEKDIRITMIKHQIPKGIGASFWDGVDNAWGEAVVIVSADNENDPREILRYYKLLKDVDMIVPFVFNKEVRPRFRNLISLIYRFIINSTFLVNFNYTNGSVIYRKSILKELDYRSKGFFYQADILIRTVKKGYLFAEVPYRLDTRKAGKSKALSLPSFLRVTKDYLRLVRDYYFKKNEKMNVHFSKDSLTAIRRNIK